MVSIMIYNDIYMNHLNRVYNFSAGPCTLPMDVLKEIQEDLLSWKGKGMSVMEMSHRSDLFGEILHDATSRLRELLNIPDNYSVFFMQGGASLQFSAIPWSFLSSDGTADYIITGAWGKKAYQEAKLVGNVNCIFDAEKEGYTFCPNLADLQVHSGQDYIHYTSNETIHGVCFHHQRKWDVPVVCDMSSDILSKLFNVEDFDLIYAGAQKNMGPAGATLVIVKDSFLEKAPERTHMMLDYRQMAKHHSMPNTPCTWSIYVCGLVYKWIEKSGGLSEIEKVNKRKASLLYQAIDESGGFYKGHAREDSRSFMNITFTLPDEHKTEKFMMEAKEKGFIEIQGHRSIGGCRLSVYNAFPEKGCELFADFMHEFIKKC